MSQFRAKEAPWTDYQYPDYNKKNHCQRTVGPDQHGKRINNSNDERSYECAEDAAEPTNNHNRKTLNNDVRVNAQSHWHQRQENAGGECGNTDSQSKDTSVYYRYTDSYGAYHVTTIHSRPDYLPVFGFFQKQQ